MTLAKLLERGALYLVTTLRSDFVPGFQAIAPELAGLLNEKAERYALPPISRVGLREAIISPAGLCGVRVESSLVERLVFDAESMASGGESGGEGQALNDGVEGRPVRVRTETGRVVSGRATGDRRIEVAL